MSDGGSMMGVLRERRAVRAAIAHIIVAWLFVQVADVVLPYLGIVDEPVRWALVISVATFPVTLFIAWLSDQGKPVSELVVLIVVAAVAVWWVTNNLPEGVRERTSIVVMPFAHDGSEEGLSRALSYEVTSLLTQTKAIDVIAYQSSNSSALRGLGSVAAAKRLNVSNVLEGSVSTRGDSMRIELRLLSAAGEAIWNAVIEESRSNLASLQARIATEVEVRLAAGDDVETVEAVAAKRCWMPTDSEALRRYYTARHYAEMRSDSDESAKQVAEAIAIYKELIDEYPNFAEAYSGLAWAYGYQHGYHREVATGEWMSGEGTKLARIALEHCPTLGEALHLIPNEYDHENNWIGEWQQRKAFAELEPHKPVYLQQLAMHYRFTGHDDKALEVAEKSYALNPLSVRSIRNLSGIEQYRGNLERAIELQTLAVELGYTGPTHATMASEIEKCEEDDLDCFIASMDERLRPFEDAFRIIYRRPSTEEEREESLQTAFGLLDQHPYLINWFNGSACENEHLAEVFFYAWDIGGDSGGWFYPNMWGDDCDHVQSDPRFAQIVEDVGLVEYWQTVGWPETCQPQDDGFACGSNIRREAQ